MKFMQASEELLKNHYADLSSKGFFTGLIKYMASGPVLAMVWEGLNAVKTGRVMLGATNPADSAPGTIRGDLCIQVGRNSCHGSDAVESANKEIALWFKPEELCSYEAAQKDWVYEEMLENRKLVYARQAAATSNYWCFIICYTNYVLKYGQL